MGGDDLRPLPLIGSAEHERLFVEQHRVAATAFALIDASCSCNNLFTRSRFACSRAFCAALRSSGLAYFV